MKALHEQLHHYIPGGCHTYSKGTDQYLFEQIPVASKSDGAWTYSENNRRYLDWMMGNRVICLGHSNKYVNRRVMQAISRGVNHSFPSVLELEAAKYFVDTLRVGEMVKFGKNGSDAISAAIRLARAYTKRNKILICADQPFYAIHDWFIGTTASNAGVDLSTQGSIIKFLWNNIESLEKAVRQSNGEVACILLEVCKFEPPSVEFITYLHSLQNNLGILIIADENINCMKFGIKGAHHYFGLKADLICYGKAIANGYSFSLLAGPRNIMQLGGSRSNLPKVFLLSQTHSSESVGIAAALATCQYYQKNNVEKHIVGIGAALKEGVNLTIKNSFLESKIYLGGLDQNPTWITTMNNEEDNLRLRSWLVKKMMDHNIILNWITITYAHKKRHIDLTCRALKKILNTTLPDDFLSISLNNLPKPVFRKFQHWRKPYSEY